MAAMSVYKDLFQFLKKPTDDNTFNEPVLKKITTVLRLLILGFGAGFIFGIIMLIMDYFKIIETGLNSINDFFVLPFYKIVLFGVLILPFFEEIVFRLPLRYQRNYIYRLIFFIVRSLRIINIEKARLYEQGIWNTAYKYFFYALSTVFAFVHISNYDNANELMAFVPVLTFSQFFNGLIIGYIRVRSGFFYGYFYHAFFNFVLLSMLILSFSKHVSYHFNEDNYVIDIKSDNASDSKNKHKLSDFKVTNDTIEFENMSLKDIISRLSYNPEKYIVDNSSFLRLKFFVKANFKTTIENSDSSRQILLQQILKTLKIGIISKKITTEAYELYFNGIKSSDSSTIQDGAEWKTTLRNIGRKVDRDYKDKFIFSIDTTKVSISKIPYEISFIELQRFLKPYGIEFRNVKKELEFMVIVNRK